MGLQPGGSGKEWLRDKDWKLYADGRLYHMKADAAEKKKPYTAPLPSRFLRPKPAILMASRFEEKKNHIGVVAAYVHSRELQDKADLVIFIRGIMILTPASKTCRRIRKGYCNRFSI